MPLAQTEPQRPTRTRSSPRSTATPQAYLQLLLEGGGEGLGGNGEELSAVLAPLRADRPATWPRSTASSRQAPRATSRARSTTSSWLSEELGARDTQLADFVDSSNAVLGVVRQPGGLDPRARSRSCRRRWRPRAARSRAATGSPSSWGRRRGADPVGASAGPGAARDAPVLPRDRRRRSATRSGRSRARCARRSAHLTEAAKALNKATPPLRSSFGELNKLFNALAFNPPGRRGELPLLVAWLNHNTNGALQLPGRARPAPARPRAPVLPHRRSSPRASTVGTAVPADPPAAHPRPGLPPTIRPAPIRSRSDTLDPQC